MAKQLSEDEFRKYLSTLSPDQLRQVKNALQKCDQKIDVRQCIKIGGKTAGMSIEMVGEFMKLLHGKKADWIYPVSKAMYDLAMLGRD